MQALDIDQLVLPSYRQQKSLPKITALDLVNAQRFGSLDPVIVRQVTRQTNTQRAGYEILHNAKTWLIAQRLGHKAVTVMVCDRTDEEAHAIVNQCVSIHDNPMDDARLLQAMLKENPTLSKAALGRLLGRTRTDISNTMRLLTLNEYVQALVHDGQLSAGHAKSLVVLNSASQVKIAQTAVRGQLSVREVEQLVRETKTESCRVDFGLESSDDDKLSETQADLSYLQNKITQRLGCGVDITDGQLIINYYHDLDILQGILEAMGIVEVDDNEAPSSVPDHHRPFCV